jgi:hypothetical protein
MMEPNDKVWLRSGLADAKALTVQSVDGNIVRATHGDYDNYVRRPVTLDRHMLITEAQRDKLVAKQQADAERRKRWHKEQRADGYLCKGNQ